MGLRRAIKRRLFLQVYATLLLAVLLSVGVMALGGAFIDADEHRDRIAGAARVIAASLPDDPDALPSALGRTGRELGLTLALYDADGAVLATTDSALPTPSELSPGDLSRYRHGPLVSVRLDDGRVMIGGPTRRSFDGPDGHILLPFGLLALLALLTWPVARRVTRRLERLQGGVESLGSGDLSARVPVEGRDEVARLARAFNRAAERIEGLVGAQQRMLASASHELRSPLARLRVAVELLADGDVAPGRRAELLDQTQRDVAELDELIEDLLLVGRLRARDPEARRRGDVDLLVIAAEEAARFGVEVDGPSAPLQGDERALRRLVRNLLENAEKHGGGDFEVTVAGGATVRLLVEDRGAGVPPDERERIFEPFHRAAHHREGEHGGVGLGLSLVREIARDHGGDARCEEREGGGTRFVVELSPRG